jgi:hypothetical protein
VLLDDGCAPLKTFEYLLLVVRTFHFGPEENNQTLLHQMPQFKTLKLTAEAHFRLLAIPSRCSLAAA